MKGLFQGPSLFFGLPLLFSCLIALATFHFPEGYMTGVALLAVFAMLTIVVDVILRIRLPRREQMQGMHFRNTREGLIAQVLAWIIIAACAVDLLAYPLPLLNPDIYARLENGRVHVRHITIMCWILPVIGMLCVEDKRVRALFIVLGLVFPILVLDRNRLFASTYATAAVLMMQSRRRLPWRTMLVLVVLAVVLFAQLGKARSGSLGWVNLPFTDFYLNATPGVKWILLYIGSGVYNFAAIVAKGYHNADFLINQIVPGAGSVVTAGSGIPFDDTAINVGTEYFPFLLAFGPVAAILAAAALFSMLIISIVMLKAKTSLFTLLIFLRVSYVCVMAGFAPQAFIWTNFGFIGLCFAMLLVASLLPSPMANQDVTNNKT